MTEKFEGSGYGPIEDSPLDKAINQFREEANILLPDDKKISSVPSDIPQASYRESQIIELQDGANALLHIGTPEAKEIARKIYARFPLSESESESE